MSASIRSKQITQKDLDYSKNKIHIKFYKPIIEKDVKDGVNVDSYEPHQGYLMAMQNRIIDGINQPNIYRYTSVKDDNMILIEQQEKIGEDEKGNPIFKDEKEFIKHQYFKPIRMSDPDSMRKFRLMFNSYKENAKENAKEYIRVEFANQVYYIEPMTEFRVNIVNHYIEERKLIEVDGEIKPESEEYKINDRFIL